MSFHISQLKRDTTHPIFKSTTADGNNGLFYANSPEPNWLLVMIGSDEGVDDGEPWEHVSVQAVQKDRHRAPNWKEMCHVKRLCWDGEDVVMQLHSRESEYVNQHPHVLHLWRPTQSVIPTPPSIMVGTK